MVCISRILRNVFPLAWAALLTGLTVVSATAAEKPVVVASIPPVAALVERVVGDFLDSRALAPEGAAPDHYVPEPSKLEAMATVDAFVAVGLPYEQAWIESCRTRHPHLHIIHADKGVAKLPLPGAPDDSARPDPHIWLDPDRMQRMTATIAEGLVALAPHHAWTFRENHARLVIELEELDAAISAIVAEIPPRHRVFVVDHPAWGYFAQAYGLRQIPLAAHGETLTPVQLQDAVAEIDRVFDAAAPRVVVAQPQFDTQLAERAARALDARLVVLDPLAADWQANLFSVAKTLEHALD